MYKILKNNIFFYVSVILAVGMVYLFSNNLNKKEVIAGLKAQIQDLEDTIETMTEEEQESRENQPEEAQQMAQEYGEQEEIQQTEPRPEVQNQDMEEEWDAVLRADYIKMDEREKADREFIAAQIWEENGIEDSELAGLKAVCPMQREGSEGEIYLFHYFVRDERGVDDGNYCGIGIDHQNNSSELLFQTDGSHNFTSLYEFYDIQVSDVDGNGEEDVILLLGGHHSAGAEYYLPDLYCMLALQKNGKFQCVNHEAENWLKDILKPLYTQQTESWKIENVIGDIRSHYGNGESEAAVEEEASLEDVIALKDSRMMEKINSRSLFFERELLWEAYDINENNHIQGIKVFKERGDNGKPLTQIAVYLFDYVTEEVEKLEVPEVYQEITDEYLGSGYIADVQLEAIEVKETEGVKNICMNVEIVVEQIEGQHMHLPYELCIKVAPELQMKKTELNMETGGEEGERREIDNPYFPVKEHMTLKVRANYYKGQEPIDEIVDAEIDRLKVYESGSIYKLKINIPIDTAAASEFPVMVRYFYVKADEIYLIWPFYQAEPNGKCIRFPDDDELLLQTFDTEEKLQNKGQIEPVCSEENIEEEEEYCFRSMKQEEDRVTFYRREIKHNGDEAQKDLFVWEKGKGLVKFETGYGPGPMEVSIDEIYEVMDEE